MYARVRHNRRMKRFGLTNVYLQAGVLLLVLGMLGYALPFLATPASGAWALLHTLTPYVLAAGIALYVIGRVVAMRRRGAG